MPNTGLMTGAEARKCWCPWARVGERAGTTYNRLPMSGEAPPSALCLASDCAAWRWSHAPGRGYCGAAGPPGANMAGEAP